MKYDVISSNNLSELKDKVREILDNGHNWKPQGGIAVHYNPCSTLGVEYLQALVKEETDILEG